MIRQAESIVAKWLHRMKIPVSGTYLKHRLLAHPDYPSLKAITDTLDDLSIDNAALVIDKERLQEAPLPFLAHDAARGNFVIITDSKKQISENPEFQKLWNGTALLAEKPENWIHSENEEWLAKERKTKQKISVSIAGMLLLAGLCLISNFSWQLTGLLVTAVIGFAVAVLIVQHELGISNELTEQLCNAGKNTDCDAVMYSKGSRLGRWMNWADAGIIYFGSFILLLTASFANNISVISILAILATLALPFTFFSLYYQWRVVKKWCTLCLLTIGVLWLQVVLLLPVIRSLTKSEEWNPVSFNNIAFTIFIFATFTVAWLLLIKPALQKNTELGNKNYSLLRFKNNPEIFELLLQQQRKVDATPFENDLQLGNPSAPLQILVACNPYCGPCAKAHEALDELVEKNHIGLTVRFAIKTDNKEDKKLQAVNYLFQLFADKTPDYKRKALHDWYAMMDLDRFKQQYPLQQICNAEEDLKQQEDWATAAAVKATPTIFINEYELPKQYHYDDLKNIIDRIKSNVEPDKEVIENKILALV